MTNRQCIPLTNGGVREISNFHVGQDMKKIEFVFENDIINVDSVFRVINYKVTSKTIEIVGVISNFSTVNEFLQKYHHKTCTINTAIFELSEQKANGYTSFPMQLVDYEISYPELGVSTVKLIFSRI